MKNKAYYFSHDGNAHNDVKIQYLIADLGMEGYGMFWFIIEKLFDAGGILPLKIVRILAKQMNVSEAKAKTVIEAYGLFKITEDSFYSQRLIRHFEQREKLSTSGKKGAKIKWGGDSQANGVAIDTLIARKEKKEKERKGKEIKEEENKLINNSDFNWQSVKKYFLSADDWMYQFSTSKSVSRETLIQLMNEFINEMELRNEFKELKELQRHFTNWFNKSQKQNKNGKLNKNSGRDELLETLRQKHAGNNIG